MSSIGERVSTWLKGQLLTGSAAADAARTAARIDGSTQSELNAENALAQAITSGRADVVESEERKIARIIGERNRKLFHLFVDIDAMVKYHLHELYYIDLALQRSNLSDAEKRELGQQLQEDHDKLSALTKQMFHAETSFDSVNMQLGQLLGFSSQARELQKKMLDLRKSDRKERKAEKKAKNVVSIAEGKRKVVLIDAAITEEIETVRESISALLLTLKKSATDLRKQERMIEALRDEQGYPKRIAEHILQAFMTERQNFQKNLDDEIAASRRRMSYAEQMELPRVA